MAHRKKCLKGMGIDPTSINEVGEDSEEDEDYFRKEIGENPHEGLFIIIN